jgi:simple sugar transport system permease protein
MRPRDIGLAGACLAGGLLALATIIRAAGASPVAVAMALAQGAFGSRYNVGETVIQTIPLLLTGLGVALAFKGRLFSIGAEGQFLVGAIAAVWAGTRAVPAAVHLPFVLLSGVLGGAAWAGIAAALRLWRGVQEVLSTLLLNFVAIQLVAWMVRGPLQEAAHQFPQSDKIAVPARLTVVLAETRLHSGVVLAALAALAVWFFLRSTASGFALRAVGAGPDAAEAAGIRVRRTLASTFLLSGGLCGLAGAVQISGVTYFLADRYSPGYGYTAIAVALLANLSPLGIVPSALFFGALTAGATSVQTAGVSSVVIQVLQAVTLLGVLAYGALRERTAR